MKKYILLLLTILSFTAYSQTSPTLPSGAKPYGNQLYILPSTGDIWGGNAGYKYRVVAKKSYVDSLTVLGYKKTQVDSLLALKANLTYVNNGLATKENTITATTSADYYRGDKTFATLNKTAVGLSNVDNTSDANKPLSVLAVASYNAASGVDIPLTNVMSPIQMFQNLQKQSDNRYTKPQSDARYQPLENQRLGTSNNVTFSRVTAVSPFGGVGTGFYLALASENANPSSSYAPIDFAIPTAGVVGQFLATANNYSGTNIPASSIGLLANKTISFISRDADIRFGTGGYAVGQERVRINLAGNVLINKTTDNGEKFQVNGKATVATAPTNATDVVRLSDMSIVNTTTTALSSATLNSTYPNVIIGFRVICHLITGAPAIYTKATENGGSDVWLTTSATVTP